jgi:acyl transferase domain-containing protein
MVNGIGTMERQDIAVVGMSFKLPQGVEDETSFWEVLQARKNLMTTWPESRINVSSFYDANPGRVNKVSSSQL